MRNGGRKIEACREVFLFLISRWTRRIPISFFSRSISGYFPTARPRASSFSLFVFQPVHYLQKIFKAVTTLLLHEECRAIWALDLQAFLFHRVISFFLFRYGRGGAVERLKCCCKSFNVWWCKPSYRVTLFYGRIVNPLEARSRVGDSPCTPSLFKWGDYSRSSRLAVWGVISGRHWRISELAAK